ncbi:hypothetical protein [Streptomyces sp. NPDC048057]|uniref:hypothetical protein n=1 Tax=Streptomyces sp. NPDC048057 TaxID=3155628 RepID=UPI00340EFAEB
MGPVGRSVPSWAAPVAPAARRPGLAAGWGFVLLLLHTLGGYLLLVALMSRSEGPWDRSVTGMVRGFAGACAVVELIAAAVTFGCVRWGVLRVWWYAPPALLLVTALLRMVFAPVP